MVKNWKIRPVDDTCVRQLAGSCSMPEPLVRALILRGQEEPERLERFLQPRLAELADPFLLPAMTTAVKRIWEAIETRQVITVFGDYDVDGVSAAALLTRVLRQLDAQVVPFIPDRLDEGYGLSSEALERCLENGASKLIITVDCGTNSSDAIAAARARGVEVIVTDHHEPDQQHADPLALINPKLDPDSCTAGQEDLSGVGIAFKLAHALVKYGRDEGRPVAEAVDLKLFLDIVALGTVTDLVPLTGDNRILVRHGLDRLDATSWEGLRALKQVAGLQGTATTYHLGYQLGPRINAAGRIGQPMQAVRLLTTDDPAEARDLANLLNKTNMERRRMEQEMTDEAFAEIDEYFDPAKDFGLVVSRPGWHPGVVGIVASRVARHYNRPAIVMGEDDDGCARGSCRSIGDFDVLDGVRAGRQYLNKYGGHKMAAGVELKPGALDQFRGAFNAAAAAVLASMDLSPVQWIDAIVAPDELGWDFFEQLRRLRPFGQDNPEPVWALPEVEVAGTPRQVGQNHLRFSVRAKAHVFEAIAFNYSLKQLPPGKLDVAFTLKENLWNGNTTLQLQVKDIRTAQPL